MEKTNQNEEMDFNLLSMNPGQEEVIVDNYEEETCQGNPIIQKPKCNCNSKKKNKKCSCKTEKINQAHIETKNENSKEIKQCSKCNNKKYQIKFRNDSCCNECFIDMIEHKFKYTLRNLLKMLKDDMILLSFSGGPNSLAMLKMISETLFNPKAKKMFFTAKVIYIDESIIYGSNSAEDNHKVKEICSQMKLDIEIIKIEDIFELKNSEQFLPILQEYNNDLNKNEAELQNSKRLLIFLDNLSNNGYSREGILFVFKLALILAYAQKTKMQKIAFGDTGQGMACKILSEIVQGRGIEIQNMISFLDEKFVKEGILIGRPMRDFLKKEILLYNYLHKIDNLVLLRENIAKNNKNLPGNGNYNILIENLLDRLQDQNNATVHTILNTLDKTKNKYDFLKDDEFCPVCFKHRDKLFNILEIGGLKNISNTNNHSPNSSEELMLKYLPHESNEESENSKKFLCFGCRRIIENSKNPDCFFQNLPSFMKNTLESTKKKYEANKNSPEEMLETFFLIEKNKN